MTRPPDPVQSCIAAAIRAWVSHEMQTMWSPDGVDPQVKKDVLLKMSQDADKIADDAAVKLAGVINPKEATSWV